MHANPKILLRTAERISAHLQGLRATPPSVDLPEGDWTYAQDLLRQLDICRRRGWKYASARFEGGLQRALERCSERLQEIAGHLATTASPWFLQSARDIFHDLESLAPEFESISVDTANRSIAVTTDSIVLEEINLGPFEIRLHWDRIGERRPYSVVALAPNPAGESSDTTHPHVKGEQLCEGDGRLAIDRALRTGRLLDFFQLVSRILETYNSGSAYVSLSEWNGSPCSDCGDTVCNDEQFTCDRCGDRLCRNCLSFCARCDAYCCHSCTNYCAQCEESICSRCLETCQHCARSVCCSCLSETGLCEECQEESDARSFDENEDDCSSLETETTAPQTPGIAEPPAAAAVAV